MPKPNQLATWNPDRDCWETGVEDIFGHSDVYSETWPTSGMTRNGVAYELPTWAPPTSGSGCSSSPPEPMFRTPCAAEAAGGPRNPDRPGATMRLSDQVREEAERGVLLPTPEAKLASSGPDYARMNRQGSGGHDLTTAVHMLPTPRATDGTKGGPNQRGSSGDMMLPSAVHQLLPTPKAGDGEFSSGSTTGRPVEKSTHLGTHALLLAGQLDHRRTGDHTPPPSTDGNPSWEDVPLPLPN